MIDIDKSTLDVLRVINDLQFNGRLNPERKARWEEMQAKLGWPIREHRDRSHYMVRLNPVPMVALRAEFWERDIDLDRECELLEGRGAIRRSLERTARRAEYLRADGKLVRIQIESETVQVTPEHPAVEEIEYRAYVNGEHAFGQSVFIGVRFTDPQFPRTFQIESFAMLPPGFKLLKPNRADTGDVPLPSAPMSLADAADAWGGSMTAVKLKQLIALGTVRANQLSRQRWVISRQDAPQLPER